MNVAAYEEKSVQTLQAGQRLIPGSGCDSGFLAASLSKHEEAAELPTGEVFLAAEGLADRQTGQGHRISTKAFYDLSYQIMRSL